MSIVKAVLELCRESWICHRCGPQDTCSGGVSRGAVKLTRLTEGSPMPHVVVDLDSVPCLSQKGRCDILYFADDAKRRRQWFAPIEVSRSKHKEPEKIQRQLQLSADLVERNLKYSGRVDLLPVFAGRSRESREIRRRRIQYKGKWAYIEVLKMNGRMCDYMK